MCPTLNTVLDETEVESETPNIPKYNLYAQFKMYVLLWLTELSVVCSEVLIGRVKVSNDMSAVEGAD